MTAGVHQRSREEASKRPGLRLVRTDGPRSLPLHDVDWSILMAHAQDGDGAAYWRLLTEITPYLRALCARHQSQTCDIEDLVQDILLSVHAVRATYDPTRPFGPWLVAIANCRIADRLRRQFRRRRAETWLMPTHENVTDGRASAEEGADRYRLTAAIAELPDHQRQAIQLLKLEEMTLREAAIRSGLSIAALKTSTHRAINRLRQMFIGGEVN